jgi:hypothetical protein
MRAFFYCREKEFFAERPSSALFAVSFARRNLITREVGWVVERENLIKEGAMYDIDCLTFHIINAS